jgi:hypothetical protein
METITSRSFQVSYQRLQIPVVVKAKSRTLGTWYPRGTEEGDTPEVEIGLLLAEKDEEIKQLKRQLAARPENERQLLAQRDEAIAEAHALRRKIEGVATKPASNVRAAAKAPTAVRVGTASYSSRPFTPVPKS